MIRFIAHSLLLLALVIVAFFLVVAAIIANDHNHNLDPAPINHPIWYAVTHTSM